MLIDIQEAKDTIIKHTSIDEDLASYDKVNDSTQTARAKLLDKLMSVVDRMDLEKLDCSKLKDVTSHMTIIGSVNDVLNGMDKSAKDRSHTKLKKKETDISEDHTSLVHEFFDNIKNNSLDDAAQNHDEVTDKIISEFTDGGGVIPESMTRSDSYDFSE